MGGCRLDENNYQTKLTCCVIHQPVYKFLHLGVVTTENSDGRTRFQGICQLGAILQCKSSSMGPIWV